MPETIANCLATRQTFGRNLERVKLGQEIIIQGDKIWQKHAIYKIFQGMFRNINRALASLFPF